MADSVGAPGLGPSGLRVNADLDEAFQATPIEVVGDHPLDDRTTDPTRA